MLTGDRAETAPADKVARMTSSASVDPGAAATLTTFPETLETVVVPLDAPPELLNTSTGWFAKNMFDASAPGARLMSGALIVMSLVETLATVACPP